MTITVTDTATGQQLTVREVSAALAIPEQHVSAPYSRAIGLLDRWVRDSRRAVDEFSAWIEGQTAQAKAEMRAMCDELDLPQVWAELPAPRVDDLVGIDPGWTGELSTDEYIDRQRSDPVTAYMRADDPDERPGRAAWINVDAEPGIMPARIVAITPTRNPLAEAYAEREARGWKPRREDYGPHEHLDPQPIWTRAWRAVKRAVLRLDAWAESIGEEKP